MACKEVWGGGHNDAIAGTPISYVRSGSVKGSGGHRFCVHTSTILPPPLACVLSPVQCATTCTSPETHTLLIHPSCLPSHDPTTCACSKTPK